ncbi:hypothetical protein CW714_03975 [Methanophagales archaeon]|nr:MAG: hypothetical protein CW714_03975 [Methanophagales archaeon]
MIEMGKPKVVVKALIVGLAVYLLLVSMLVPAYGIAGAAWGIIVSSILITFILANWKQNIEITKGQKTVVKTLIVEFLSLSKAPLHLCTLI